MQEPGTLSAIVMSAGAGGERCCGEYWSADVASSGGVAIADLVALRMLAHGVLDCRVFSGECW